MNTNANQKKSEKVITFLSPYKSVRLCIGLLQTIRITLNYKYTKGEILQSRKIIA